MSNTKHTIERWIKEYVLHLNLCPFAHAVIEQKTYEIFCGKLEDSVRLLNEATFAIQKQGKVTTFIVLEEELNLDDALEFYYAIIEVLEELGLEEDLKPILFHPQFLHKDIPEDDAVHYSSRSPKTIIQFLLHSEMDRLNAKALSPKILEDNEKTLRSQGVIKLEALLKKVGRGT